MCGVVASIGPRAERHVDVGLEAMSYRGVRSSRRDYGGMSIGHVRLPIVGLDEKWDQPVVMKDWVVAFVGEILDFRDYRPNDECDLNLVLETWDEEGPTGFRNFDGFWSVVAIEEEKGELHCLTDYLCQKPMYFREDIMALASEPRALARMAETTLDPVYLAAIRKWGYCPEPNRTPYCEIQRMNAGEWLTMNRNRGVERRVVDPLCPIVSFDERDLFHEILGAVERRVQSSDVPVACLVSGGLDSSIVYDLARDCGDIDTFHVENGEWEDCLRVVRDQVPVLLSHEDLSMGEGLDYMQEPMDLGSLLPQVSLSNAVKEYRVCLTGDGADEFFGGYGRALRYDSQASDVYHELMNWHLPRLDRVMMRNGIEVRSPFLARKVAGMAMGLPKTLRTDKKILRDVFAHRVPEAVKRKKKALRTPEVERDREENSILLARLFQMKHARDGYA